MNYNDEQDMGIELEDFRGKLSAETHCVLDAEARISGDDKQRIVRDVLHAWALKKMKIARVTDDLLRAKGMPGLFEGTTGKKRESRE